MTWDGNEGGQRPLDDLAQAVDPHAKPPESETRCGLRVAEAPALCKRDLEPGRGSLQCATARAVAGARSA
jgi:hypothetical protein